MANHCRLASATAIAALNAVVDLIDAGGGGSLFIYTGTEPDYANDAGSLTEVATLPFGGTAYAGAAADAVNHWADANLTGGTAITVAAATGNASAVTCFRVKDGSAGVILQGTVGTTGCDINLNSATIGAGATVTVTALEIRCPYNQA
jgi:hypothetical protein